MKKTVLAVILALCTATAIAQGAQTPQEAELLSAQIAYQQALKNYNTHSTPIAEIQARLDNAKRRFQEAQSDVQRAEQQLATAQNAQSTAAGELKNAGARLDAAWAAVRGKQ